MKSRLLLFIVVLFVVKSNAQRFQAGVTFQYIVFKQVNIDADVIIPKESYNFYYNKRNGFKLFSAGQSIVIGTSFQYNIKRFYIGIEPTYELNTYNYKLYYPISPNANDEVSYQTLFFQVDAPVYLGYQFKTSNLIRYSVFAGAMPVLPYHVEFDFNEGPSPDATPDIDNYWVRDLNGILYSNDPYVNGMFGVGIHFASLIKVDFRFTHRFGSPGPDYKVAFNSAGFALTYYLPFNLLKQRVYYEK